jgi:hypothetical protein
VGFTKDETKEAIIKIHKIVVQVQAVNLNHKFMTQNTLYSAMSKFLLFFGLNYC